MFGSKNSTNECYINEWTFESSNTCLCSTLYTVRHSLCYLLLILYMYLRIIYNRDDGTNSFSLASDW